MTTPRHPLKSLAVALLTAGLIAPLTANAAITEANAKRIKPDYPLSTMADWLAAPTQYALNPANIRAGTHPDRDDPQGGPYDVIYIFPDAITANNWWDGNGTPPDEIPDDAVAFVHWELDNQSGTFPGIMSKSDIDGFKSRNCIMAAGATIPVPGPDNPAIEKTCSNPQGTSKRFKMNILKPDVPVDLVYNVEGAPLTYTNYDVLPEHDGIEESGRIYRVLQKWHNASGMDSATEVRPGVRIAGFRMELGTGVGGAFAPIANAANDGLAPDKALGYELRPCMADHFFDVKRDRPGTGTNPCSTVQDTNAQDLPQEIWLEEEYSTFSPKMYSFNDDKRTTPVGGFWDKQPGGIEPPQIQTQGKLDSGYVLSTDAAYDRIDPSGVAADNLPVFYGATTPNYLGITDNQASAVVDGDGIDSPSPFGYLMYFGVLADGDIGNIAQGIVMDEDGDPATEGDLHAWWDGSEYRWGGDPDLDGVIDDSNKFSVIAREQLVEWALHPLEETPDFTAYPDTGFPPGPLYEIGLMDDLAGLNVDSFVYLGRSFAGTEFTIRLTAVPVDSADPYGDGTPTAFPLGTVTGNETPAWVGSPAPALDTFVNDDGVIDIKALGFAGDPLLVSLADTGIVGTLPTVSIENLRTGETEDATLVQDAGLLWKFTFTQATAADGVAGSNNDGTLNVWPNDLVRVTYVDAFDGTNANVVKTDEVQIPIETITPPPPPVDDDDDTTTTTSSDGGGGGGCTLATSTSGMNITMPLLMAGLLGFAGLRRRTQGATRR